MQPGESYHHQAGKAQSLHGVTPLGAYLEGRREVILEEPELDGGSGVPQDGQHHYSGTERWREERGGGGWVDLRGAGLIKGKRKAEASDQQCACVCVCARALANPPQEALIQVTGGHGEDVEHIFLLLVSIV